MGAEEKNGLWNGELDGEIKKPVEDGETGEVLEGPKPPTGAPSTALVPIYPNEAQPSLVSPERVIETPFGTIKLNMQAGIAAAAILYVIFGMKSKAPRGRVTKL